MENFDDKMVEYWMRKVIQDINYGDKKLVVI